MSTAQTKKKSVPLFSLCILVATYILILPTGILLTAALLPTLTARIADPHPKRYLTFCIGSLNVCGSLPYAIILWQGENTLKETVFILSQQTTWLSFYGSSALGLLIYSLMPSIMRVLRLNQLNMNIQSAEKNKEQLLELWGDKILPQHTTEEKIK